MTIIWPNFVRSEVTDYFTSSFFCLKGLSQSLDTIFPNHLVATVSHLVKGWLNAEVTERDNVMNFLPENASLLCCYWGGPHFTATAQEKFSLKTAVLNQRHTVVLMNDLHDGQQWWGKSGNMRDRQRHPSYYSMILMRDRGDALKSSE